MNQRSEVHMLAWRAQVLNDAMAMATALKVPLVLAKAIVLRASATGAESGPMAMADALGEMVDATLELRAEVAA